MVRYDALPVGWSEPRLVETVPQVLLTLVGSDWPAAEGDLPAGTSRVSSWSVERELVGSVLPGNVRARSGLSIGSASAQIPQRPNMLTPWARTAPVTTGTRAELSVIPYRGGEQLDLGDWLVDPATGSISSASVGLELIEAQYAGRRQLHTLATTVHSWDDPAWIVSQLAKQAGYYSTPPVVASSVLCIPLDGGLALEYPGPRPAYEYGPYFLVADWAPDSWGNATGKLGPVGGLEVFYLISEAIGYAPGESWFVTLDRAGGGNVVFRLGYEGGDVNGDTYLRVDVGTVEVRHRQDAAYVPVTYTTGLDANHPNRVQIELKRLGQPDLWTGISIRARSAHGAAWSSWVTSTATSDKQIAHVLLTMTPLATASAIQFTHEADPALWVPVTADIQPLGGIIAAPYLPGEIDAWSGIQQVASAWLGAAWVSRDGIFNLRNKEYLAGVGTVVEDLDIGTSAVDLGWSIDPADTADRLVVTYIPVDIEDQYGAAPTGLKVWEAPDVYEVPPHGTVEVVANIPVWADITVFGWIRAWADDVSLYNVWSAYTARNPADGVRADNRALTITDTRLSTGRQAITIINNTVQTLYMVDANAKPCLILYAGQVARQENTATLTRGASEADSINPVSVELGNHVQREVDAMGLADYIWARVSSPSWKASSVRVAPDWRRDIGDIVRLAHGRTGLAVKALVTKVAYDGAAGEVSQTLDLVLLENTWQDFNDAQAGSTWALWNANWAGRTWADFDYTPLEV